MMIQKETQVSLPAWWFILPAYLTLWSLAFSFWNLADGEGMMKAFTIETGGASEFIMLNSASRYVAIAMGMVVGIWVFKTLKSILTALIIRLVMDILDLYSGIATEVIVELSGVFQSLLMFLIPNLISIILLIRLSRKQ